MLKFIRRLFKISDPGVTRWKLRPSPVMPSTYTVGEVEKVCALLDLDVDLILSGDITAGEMKLPKIDRAQDFLMIVCQNGDKYNVREWTTGQYEGVMAALLANFMLRLVIN